MMKKNSNSGQVALEFILLVLFGFVVVALIMYGVGLFVVDFRHQQQVQTIDDMAQSILNEFEIASQSTNGFSRKVVIRSDIIQRYNISINQTTRYLILQDALGTDPTMKYYYDITTNFDYNYTINGSNAGILMIYHNNTRQHNGLDLEN